MSLAVNHLVTEERKANALSTSLAKWYADHASIRRLWAIEDRGVLVVFIALEPTSDGDDMLPVWLANNSAWTNDLKSLTQRELRLLLVVSDVFARSDVDTDAAMIAEINWRDSWIYPLST